jgi:UDP-glucose 4-epimerase
MKVIVTGSSGYIGGQTILLLKEAGYEVYGIDRRQPPNHLQGVCDHFLYQDFSSDVALDWIIASQPNAIIHCAGTSLVGPSQQMPSVYYENNFVATKRLLDHIVTSGATSTIRIVFSSTAAVYGEPVMTPCQEEDPPLPINPYGESKLMVEMMMQSYFRAYGLQPVMFRYFNACGADPQGRHGQEPGGTHIIARVLESLRDDKEFTLYGTNYHTADGTCIRDYIHVNDIAQAHVLALNSNIPTGIYNLGTNKGISNREIIAQAEAITGKKLRIIESAPRAGDPAELTASSTRFDSIAGNWKHYTIEDMICHAWDWVNV